MPNGQTVGQILGLVPVIVSVKILEETSKLLKPKKIKLDKFDFL